MEYDFPNFRVPLSQYTTFLKEFEYESKGLRFGQAFYTYAKLEKIHSDKIFCDKLYNANDVDARNMILSIIDRQQ